MSREKKNNNSSVLIAIISVIVVISITGIGYLLYSSKGTYSSSVFDNCLFIGDSRYVVGFYNGELTGLGNNVVVRAVSGSTVSQWKSTISTGSGNVNGTSITLPSSASCVSIMLGANSADQGSITKMKEEMQILHQRYPNARIVFNSIYHLGSAYVFGTAQSIANNKSYDAFNSEMQKFCNANSSWAGYADITAGIHDANGFLKYPDSSGIHLNSAGIPIFVQNIKTEVGRAISGGSGNQVNSKIILQATSKYPWADGSVGKKSISCSATTDVSEINSWLKNSPDVVWNNSSNCDGNDTKQQYFDYEECGGTYYPCAKPGTDTPSSDTPSSDTPSSETPSSEPKKTENDSAPFDDIINGDRCYKGSWVRVTECQKRTVEGSQCKLSTGALVLRQDGNLTGTSGCLDLPNPYDDPIDDYKCDSSSGTWVYIASCQSQSLIGAKCKSGSSTIIRTYLTSGSGCTGAKPTRSNDNNNQSYNNTYNPQTGTFEFAICMIIGITALIVSSYYYKKNKKINN